MKQQIFNPSVSGKSKIPDFLCSQCAKNLKGECYEGHDMTYNDFCGQCEEFTAVKNKRNWYFRSESKDWHD